MFRCRSGRTYLRTEYAIRRNQRRRGPEVPSVPLAVSEARSPRTAFGDQETVLHTILAMRRDRRDRPMDTLGETAYTWVADE